MSDNNSQNYKNYENTLPKVSVIIVNWNGGVLLHQCLKSVLTSNYPKDKLEVIVIDNASTDGSDEICQLEFPEIILIKNKENLGFCEGNNIGITKSTGDIVILLNNDCFVEPNWILEIVKVMERSDVGIVGCKLVYPHTGLIQSCGCNELFPGYWEHIASGLKIEEFNIEDPFEVDYVPGAAMAIKRQVLKKVGLLDPIFWAYVEDVDFCYRARNAGFKIFLAPKAIAYHYGSTSWNRKPLKRFFLEYRNKFLFIYKNYRRKFLIEYLFKYLVRFTSISLINFLHRNTSTQRFVDRIIGNCGKTSTSFKIKILLILIREYLYNAFFFIVSSFYCPYYIRTNKIHQKWKVEIR
ncbi:MAG: glycosyltransferase family 2 protein [Nitrososphaeria archaeon]